jgi:hypothetical protein
LPGGSSLAGLLDKKGVKRNSQKRPRLTVTQILELADAFHQKHGYWPFCDSGPIGDLPGETWATIDRALSRGLRGLPAGKPLATLLNERRGIFGGRTRRLPRVPRTPPLQLDQIREWGAAYRKRHGIFPNRSSGAVANSGGLKWSTIDSALKHGSRGLAAGSSLAKLFGDRRHQRKRKRRS